ncbi:MAG: hypothetical protein ACXQTF_04330 [Candidatus Hecatellaceae archaeon]
MGRVITPLPIQANPPQTPARYGCPRCGYTFDSGKPIFLPACPKCGWKPVYRIVEEPLRGPYATHARSLAVTRLKFAKLRKRFKRCR